MQWSKLTNDFALLIWAMTFFAEGILDQFIYVNPEEKIIVVRTERDWSKSQDIEWFIKSMGDLLYMSERESKGY